MPTPQQQKDATMNAETTELETLTPAEVKRASILSGWRKLITVFEDNADIDLPMVLNRIEFNLFHVDNPLTDATRMRRAIGGRWEKRPWSNYFSMDSKVDGLEVEICTQRDKVCERVVTGTREVTTTAPDATIPDTRPVVTTTTVVEDIEWVCPPSLLGES